MVSEEEMFKNLYKDHPQASQLHSAAPKKVRWPPLTRLNQLNGIIYRKFTGGFLFPSQAPTPSSAKSPGSALKLKTMRRMRESGWSAVSKMDRKRKMKEAVKFFA